MKKQMKQAAHVPKALTPPITGKKSAPKTERPGQAAKVEAKTEQFDPRKFSKRKNVVKKTEPDVVPAGNRPNTLRSKTINSKKLDDIRI